jgi:hypothetical protein
MGTPTAPSYANIFLYSLERNLLTLYKPLYFRRYIDDIFVIFDSPSTAQLFFDAYNLQTPSIKLDLVSLGRNGVILDLDVHLTDYNNTNDIITHNIYQKPMNIYQYITPTSEHQRHILKNFILNELKRYRLHCTHDLDYDNVVTSFLHRLCARGYPVSVLTDPLTQVPPRQTLLNTIKLQTLNKKNPLLGNTNDRKPIIILNIPRLLNIDKWSTTLKLPEYLTCLRQFKKAYNNNNTLTIGRRNPPTIGSHLVRSTYTHTYPVNNLKRFSDINDLDNDNRNKK